MPRVVVIGVSCAGKSTFAAALARRLGHPYVELDELHWGPNWTPRPSMAFLADVALRRQPGDPVRAFLTPGGIPRWVVRTYRVNKRAWRAKLCSGRYDHLDVRRLRRTIEAEARLR